MIRGVFTVGRIALRLSYRNRRPSPLSTVAAAATSVLLFSPISPVSAMSPSARPSRPLQYRRLQTSTLDLSSLGSQVAQSEERRNEAYDRSREIQIALVQARTDLETSQEASEASKKLESLVASAASPDADRTPREANLSNRFEDYVRYKAYMFFLDTGRLLPPSDCPFVTDEEYLAGACMGLASDLARYGLGRATERDAASVAMARDLVQDIMDELLQFDFRNGPLRRKYDGTKYSLKSLETLLYELSVTGSGEEPVQKRLRQTENDSETLLPKEELEALRLRMEHRDELRERLIKRCRDGQKAAKQSIFALHRGDKKRAMALLAECEDAINDDLLPIVNEEPRLRYGSFANVLEEFAEARLFYSWLYGKDTSMPSDAAASGVLLTPDDFTIKLEPEEYLGGLCDLTGEVGRFAVQRGTARDKDGVRLCLHTNGSILIALQTMQRVPGGIGKKMDQVRRSVEKLERMLYEMSLSEATGGRKVNTDSGENPTQDGV